MFPSLLWQLDFGPPPSRPLPPTPCSSLVVRHSYIVLIVSDSVQRSSPCLPSRFIALQTVFRHNKRRSQGSAFSRCLATAFLSNKSAKNSDYSNYFDSSVMVSKKTKMARRAAKEAEIRCVSRQPCRLWIDLDICSPSETVPSASASPTPEPESAPAPLKEEIDPITRAEKIKEQGNAAFRNKRYTEAIDFYTQAIGTCRRPDGYITLALTAVLQN